MLSWPLAPVLDPFNAGASQALTARTGWGATQLQSGSTSFSTDATPTKCVGSSQSDNFWNTQWQDAECGVVMASAPGGAYTFEVYTRITAKLPLTAYALQVNSVNLWQLFSVAAGVYTGALGGASATRTVSIGDIVLLQAVGPYLTAFHVRPGSFGWVPVLSVTDTAITATGNIGMWGNVTATQFDAFMGGPFISQAALPGQPFQYGGYGT